MLLSKLIQLRVLKWSSIDNTKMIIYNSILVELKIVINVNIKIINQVMRTYKNNPKQQK